MLKDYYKILELTPQASPADIRKSFRKLAMRYHPDKHPEDQVAAAHFREIQEAYETLTDPDRLNLYLQERWYAQSMGRKMRDRAPLTTFTILQDIISLEKYLSTQDPYRTDQAGMESYLQYLLSEDAMSVLKQEKDMPSLLQIRDLLLSCGRSFNTARSQALAEKIRTLFTDNPDSQRAIDQFLQIKQQADKWDKWKVPLFLLVTLLICLMIYFSARP